MTLDGDLAMYQPRVEAFLDALMPSASRSPARLHEAMRYAVLGGGKRLRPLLVYASGHTIGAVDTWLDAPAGAVELIHSYSLIHDDLPAMDDDDLRRGRPTCHRAFDESTALLAGDALQSLAFRALTHGDGAPPEQRLAMVATLASAAGSQGMAGGQAIDLAAMGKTLDAAELEAMHIRKTGALIRASVRLGGLCAPEPPASALQQLDHYAKCIGLAFQVQDDILDVTGEQAVTGKVQGGDARLQKPTYPGTLGLAEAQRFAERLLEDALASLDGFDESADVLRRLARYVVARDH